MSVHRVVSGETTIFQNRYEGGARVQQVWARAPVIESSDIPPQCRKARIALLGPVLGEVSPALAELFSKALVGFCAQGWLRDVRADGLVVRRPWDARSSVRGVNVVIVSDDDMENDRDALELWRRDVPVIVVTGGKGGARVYSDGDWRRIAAFPHHEVDPTGAGDIFAAAFLIALDETKSVADAARFATAAAGLSVEGQGIASVAGRSDIERVLAAHPEVVLK